MISLWRRTLEPSDLRVQLLDGDIMMGYFDNREEALDWLWERINEADDRIREHERQIADEEGSVQEMLDFLTDISNTNWSHKLLDADTQLLSEQPEWFANPNPPEDASGLEGKLPKALLERPDRRLREEIQELQARAAELEDEVEALITGGKFSPTTKE